MFINNLTLMLINMVAGFVLLILYIVRGLGSSEQRRWVPGFAMTGLVALLTGLYVIWRWPLPGSYNIAFGEMTVLFGVIYLGAALAMALGGDLLSVAVYATLAGLAAIVVGVRIISLGMTLRPIMSGVGFILAGASGPLLLVCQQRPTSRLLRSPDLRADGLPGLLGPFGRLRRLAAGGTVGNRQLGAPRRSARPARLAVLAGAAT